MMTIINPDTPDKAATEFNERRSKNNEENSPRDIRQNVGKY
jgi:hypothetical protein